MARVACKLQMAAVLIAVLNLTHGDSDFLDERVKWTGGVYKWSCSVTKNAFKNNGWYISKNAIATRVAIYNEEAIVALPRYKAGVPATLARLVPSNDSLEAILDPYPCWKLHEEGTCESLQNVVDIFLDPYNILWILDTGVVNILEDPVRKCPPKVLAVNVSTQCTHTPKSLSTAPLKVTTGCIRPDVLYLTLLRCPNSETSLIFTYLGSSRVFSMQTRHVQRGSVDGKIRDLGPKPRRMVFLGTDNGSALFFRYEGESTRHSRCC